MLQFSKQKFVWQFIKGDTIIISTKEKIKKEALTLFAKKGYYGTTVGDIADAVGILKGSLYAHYSGKDDIFLAVYKDVTNEYQLLFEQLLDASKNMTTQDKLRYNFVEYILYFYRNPELLHFGNMCFFHVPEEVYEKTLTRYADSEKIYRETMEHTFEQGMREGIIRMGDPKERFWSFRAKREGSVAIISKSPELTEESIKNFWNDFWFGMQEGDK